MKKFCKLVSLSLALALLVGATDCGNIMRCYQQKRKGTRLGQKRERKQVVRTPGILMIKARCL